MAELRRDPIVGRWVVMDTDHAKGPKDFHKEKSYGQGYISTCPFCPGREHFTPPETDALRPESSEPNKAGWLVRTVPNKFPALTSGRDIDKEAYGMFDVMNGVGAHEVIIETPDHHKQMTDLSPDELEYVIQQFVKRSQTLSKDPLVEYVVIFKNFGSSAGATLEHAHSQIIALPMVPKTVNEELRGSHDYFEQHKRCIFCDVIEQEYKDKDRIVCENKAFLAFNPYVSRYPFETWIFPKAHQASFPDITSLHQKELAEHLLDVLKRLNRVLDHPAFNFFIHTAPVRYAKPGCYHWHIEIIPKLTRSIGFEWGTGLHINPTYPHIAAKSLRES